MNYFNQKDKEVPPYVLLGKPNYYDSPEGTKPWEKIWGLSKYVIPISLTASTFDVLFHSRAKNFLEAANVAAFWTVPLLGLTTTFASVTFIATNLRGKDDKINYACGVLACAPVLHAWRKSTAFTLWGVSLLMLAALFKKDCMQRGWILLPDGPRFEGNYVYDFSLTKEEWPRRPL